jgi:hypothetical protein
LHFARLLLRVGVFFMADITLTSGSYIRPWYSPWGAFPVKMMKLSTGISTLIIRVGTVVGLDVNSTSFQDCIVPSSVSASSGTALLSTAIVGVAAENSTAIGNNSAQGTQMSIWEANPAVEFVAATRNGLLNSTCVGQVKELWNDSTLNIHVVNIGASSLATPLPKVVVTGLVDNSGDSGGRVTFRFITRDPAASTANNLAFFK